MSKKEFFKDLSMYLSKMKEADRNKFINYYEEMISDYMEDGLSEEEAVNKVGDPKIVAKELVDNSTGIKINLPSTGSKAINLFFLIAGFPLWGSILLTIILSVLSIYLVLWCLPFALGASCIAFFASSIVGVVGSPFIMAESLPHGVLQLGTGIAAIGLSLILGIAAIDLSKWVSWLTKTWNAKLLSVFRKKVVI